MAEHFTFQSYAWSLGTTSFRMANFHRRVEEQLMLLSEFWGNKENSEQSWVSNSLIQVKYYDFAYAKGFITGNISDDVAKKAKTARQKTSGLVDIGLIDDNRRLTSVGKRLCELAKKGDFTTDNVFQIPADSYIYLKQLMKTTYYDRQSGEYVRPYFVVGWMLSKCEDYLTDDEFTYLLPLCVNREITEKMVDYIKAYRAGEITINKIIKEVVLSTYSYPDALNYFLASEKKDEDIMTIGMNRDGIRHDEAYARLYYYIKKVYYEHDFDNIDGLVDAAKKIKNKPGVLWRNLLYDNQRSVRDKSDLKNDIVYDVETENQMAERFFVFLHIFKIKANLSDFKDLNRRYLAITDSFIFSDGKVTLAPIFKYFFKTSARKSLDEAFSACDLLAEDCSMEEIHKALMFHEEELISVYNRENKTNVSSMDEIYNLVENARYTNFRSLIDSKFSNDILVSMFEKCETRDKDKELIEYVGGEADVPTIFEYIVGIAWYRISGYKGKILDYMNLSLDVNMLPRTHAGGGESDIVYLYDATKAYPKHALLIECTLMKDTVQRHGEMEPVSRHLARYMIENAGEVYCTFVANNLHPSVVSDFRGRRDLIFYVNDEDYVEGMKIIPLHTKELRTILKKNISYEQLYLLFSEAHENNIIRSPLEWYDVCVKNVIDGISGS